MLGIIIQLLLSWALLRYFDRNNLSALGIAPTKSGLISFFAGFVLAAIICAAYNLLTTAFVDNGWRLNKQLGASGALQGVWWVLKSVLFEELIFRGALLYLTIRKVGTIKACLLSAACFGVYHWFSYGAFGNPVNMFFILLMTGTAGLMFAYAFAKMGSIYLPIALHLGWNLVHIIVFSNGPLGAQVFQKMNGNQAPGFLSLLIFLFQLFALPILAFFFIRRFSKHSHFDVQ